MSTTKGNERTGTIEWRNDIAYARVRVDAPDGRVVRKRISLGTRDEKVAKRKLAKIVRMVAAGEIVFDEGAAEAGPEEFRPFAQQWVGERRARGVAMAGDEEINLTKHIYDVQTEGRTFGTMCMADVRPRHIVTVLQSAIDKKLRKGTVDHIKRLLSRIFRAAIGADILPPGANPVTAATTPRIPDAQRTDKERAVLTDEEFSTLIASPLVEDVELKMVSLVARVLGGERTGEVNAWTWSNVDTRGFTVGVFQRGKTGKYQKLEIPEPMRPFLAAWWHRSGMPSDGPVFPVTKGPNKGQFRPKRGVSYAKRLRRALRAASITRPELFNETPLTKPVDFHSFRRAFAGALAEAEVNAQTAMILTHHSDAKVHQRYVERSSKMRVIPEAAIPRLNAQNGGEVGPTSGPLDEPTSPTPEIQSGKPGSNRRPSAWEADARVSLRERAPLSDSEDGDDGGSGGPCFTERERAWSQGAHGEAGGSTASETEIVALAIVSTGVRKVARVEAWTEAGADGQEPLPATFDELIDDALAVGGAS